MSRSTLATLTTLFAVLAAVGTATAGWPPCTCDPNPVEDLAYCLLTGERCEDYELPALPPAPQPDLGDLDPRTWPCTCDPVDPVPVLA